MASGGPGVDHGRVSAMNFESRVLTEWCLLSINNLNLDLCMCRNLVLIGEHEFDRRGAWVMAARTIDTPFINTNIHSIWTIHYNFSSLMISQDIR